MPDNKIEISKLALDALKKEFQENLLEQLKNLPPGSSIAESFDKLPDELKKEMWTRVQGLGEEYKKRALEINKSYGSAEGAMSSALPSAESRTIMQRMASKVPLAGIGLGMIYPSEPTGGEQEDLAVAEQRGKSMFRSALEKHLNGLAQGNK